MRHLLKTFFSKIIYQRDHELLNNPYKKSQDFYIIQALFATAFGIFTGGVFLSGFMVYLGARDELIGYIGLIPSISGIFLIFSGLILECFHRRKKLVMWLTFLSKFLMCSIILIPLFVPKPFQVIVIFLVLIAGYILNAINGVAINNWFISVVPVNIRGRYFSIRQTFALILSIFLPFIAGRLMDNISNKYIGFVILYSLGMLMILGEDFSFANIEEPAHESIGRSNLKFFDVFRLPVKNKVFVYYTVIITILNVCLFISCSFTQVYMLRYLKLSYTFINTMGIFSAIFQIVFYLIWGKISDKHGHDFVMRTSIWFYAGELSIWTIMSRDTLFIMPIAFVFSAIANSGFAIGSFNRRYSIIPEMGRSLYDSFFSTAIGIAMIISPMIGGVIKSGLASIAFIQNNIKFGEFRLLYGLSVLGIIGLQVFDVFKRKRWTAVNDEIKYTSEMVS